MCLKKRQRKSAVRRDVQSTDNLLRKQWRQRLTSIVEVSVRPPRTVGAWRNLV